jgi:hypothetical protein
MEEYISVRDKFMQLNKANLNMEANNYSGESSYFERF